MIIAMKKMHGYTIGSQNVMVLMYGVPTIGVEDSINVNSETGGGVKSCGRPGKDFSIHVDGKVSVCCLDVCEQLVIGDLKNESWHDIINGPKLALIIQKHSECEFQSLGICAECDQIHDRSNALIYATNKGQKVGMKAGFDSNQINFLNDVNMEE